MMIIWGSTSGRLKQNKLEKRETQREILKAKLIKTKKKLDYMYEKRK